jgi:hypothetical protein
VKKNKKAIKRGKRRRNMERRKVVKTLVLSY